MVKVVNGIYGLPQAGKIAQDKLNRLLAKHGYQQTLKPPTSIAIPTETLHLLLSSMTLESNMTTRQTWTNYLPPFVRSMK
jgi:hypothetical protein